MEGVSRIFLICHFLRLITDLDIANTHLVNLIEGVLRNLSGKVSGRSRYQNVLDYQRQCYNKVDSDW